MSLSSGWLALLGSPTWGCTGSHRRGQRLARPREGVDYRDGQREPGGVPIDGGPRGPKLKAGLVASGETAAAMSPLEVGLAVSCIHHRSTTGQERLEERRRVR